MRLIQLSVIIFLYTIAAFKVAQAQTSNFGDSRDYVRITVYPDKNVVEPGDNLRLAIIFDLQPKWHIHTNNPIVPPELGDPEDYIKTQITVGSITDEALIAHPQLIKWPKPHATMVSFLSDPVEYLVFSARSIAYLPVIIRNDAEPGPAHISLNLTYQACDDKLCVGPVRGQSFSVALNVVSKGQAPVSQAEGDSIFDNFPEHVWEDLDRGPEPIGTSSANKLLMIVGIISGIIITTVIVYVVIRLR